jgi:hypothetical protein
MSTNSPDVRKFLNLDHYQGKNRALPKGNVDTEAKKDDVQDDEDFGIDSEKFVEVRGGRRTAHRGRTAYRRRTAHRRRKTCGRKTYQRRRK